MGSWKGCKYLGSLIDSGKDLSRRKGLIYNIYHKYKMILNNKNIRLSLRLKLFNSYVKPSLLYKSELRTLTKQMEQEIDILQRKFLRSMLNIHYPDSVTSDEV